MDDAPAAARTAFPIFNPQAQVCGDCGVRKLALFGTLDAEGLSQLHHRIDDLSFEPGQPLYAANEPARALYTIRSGVVYLDRLSEAGGRRIVRLAGPADLLGLEAVLGQTYASEAVAGSAVQVCRLPRALVEELCRSHPSVTQGLMQRWQRALDEAEEWLTELSTGSARWRLLRLLLKLAEYQRGEQPVWLPMREQMGAMLNLSVETCSRQVAALKRERVITLPDHRHVWMDMPRLLEALRLEAEAGEG